MRWRRRWHARRRRAERAVLAGWLGPLGRLRSVSPRYAMTDRGYESYGIAVILPSGRVVEVS